MKIIEDGNYENFKMQVRCECVKPKHGDPVDSDKRHCNSLLEIDEEDVKASRWQSADHKKWGVNFLVKCPKCKCRIYLDEDKIPAWVRNYAISKNKDIGAWPYSD